MTRKSYTYISTKFFKRYYEKTSKMFLKKKFIWERNTSAPIFLTHKSFYIHKGLYFRLKRIEYHNMSTKLGTFAFTRKPFTPPIKRVKGKKRGG